jgi:hypothetical protein
MKLHFLTAVIIIELATALLPVPIRAGNAVGSVIGPVDAYFVTQTSLGTPFQVDSGRLAETRGTTRTIQKLRAADGEFTHHREQCINSDSEKQGANAATYALESSLLHDGFRPGP